MSKKMSDLVVITKAKDMSNYIFKICDNSPKKFRLTLISKMQNLSLEIISKLYEANEIYVEMNLIKDISLSIDAIDKNENYRSENERYYFQNKLLQLKLTRALKLEERISKRLDCSYRALTLLKELDHIIIVAKEMQCITNKQYEQLAEHIFNVQNLIGAFIKSDKKRFNY